MKNRVMLMAMTGLALAMSIGCMTSSREVVKEVHPAIDLTTVPDGVYEGSALYRNFTYRVATTVKDHRITDIHILSNKNSRHGRKAEGMLPLILREQRLDVDGISGATLCSTGLKRAVADSLASDGKNP